MHGSPARSPGENLLLTAAEALKEEFVQLHGPLPDYHTWLSQLPPEPMVWRLHKDHFKNPRPLLEDLQAAGTPLTAFLRERLSPETVRALEACQRSPFLCETFFASLADDLNRLFIEGHSLYANHRFDAMPLTPPTEALARSAPAGQRLEILNRLLLEEAFPNSIAKVWDTLAGVNALLHTRHRTALCLSGGGIRSATFGLGVLQGLAQHDLLGQFDYLSTVSGGGYIGSWLSSWIYHAGSAETVFDSLKNRSVASPVDPEPDPFKHLRKFSNYLTPRLGVFSADTWTLVGIYLRNLCLNWTVFLPLLVAVLALPRLAVSLLRLPVQPAALVALVVAGVLLASWGTAYGAMQRPSLATSLHRRNRFWSKHADQGSFLIYCLLPLWLSAVCFTTFWAWYPSITFEMPPLWLFAAGGAGLHLCGWLLSTAILRRASFSEFGAVVLTGALGGLLLWLVAREAFTNLRESPDLELYVCLALPVFLAVFLVTATLFVGLTSWRTTDSDREWWARMGAWMLITILAWSGSSIVILFGPLLLLMLPARWTALGGLPGLFTILVGFNQYTPPHKEEAAKCGWSGKMLNWGLALAAPLFILFTVALVSLGTTALLRIWAPSKGLPHLEFVHNTPLWLNGALIGGSGLLGVLMSSLININRFSLHSVYRNRLIRAYLGASNPQRDPNPFTGFDPEDNIHLSHLAGQRPLHIVNMALNLVSGENLAWQQRKAETFTASALHAGNFRLGYRRAAQYAQNEKNEGLSLGTAVTISGAAASPNMGYHSSPVVAVIMTLFNVRLGAWLGNPGPAGNKSFTNPAPRNPALHVLKEAFSLTDTTSPYVYLSDGGHFENLGLYEMVLRRCHCIVLSDAGCDPKCSLEDLGNAIRKIRIDLGVPIEMNQFEIHARNVPGTNHHCAIGEIQYDRVDGPQAKRGLFIYIKPSISGDEPRDVFNYTQTTPDFPHESTRDQWFSESQFESYRMLGQHIVTEMCQDWQPARDQFQQAPPLALFARQTYKYLGTALPSELERLYFSSDKAGASPAADRAKGTAAAPTDPTVPKSF